MNISQIVLPFCPSSNMAYPTISLGGKKTKRVKSKRMRVWEASCPIIDWVHIHKKCTISYKIFFPNDAIRDGQSYMKAPLDYIVSQGIIEDDNRRIVKGEQWVDGGIDRENPRIEITIKEID